MRKLSAVKIVAMVGIFLMIFFSLTGCGATQNTSTATNQSSQSQSKPANESPANLTFAVPPSTSPLYSYWVGVAKAVQKVYPNYHITVSEATGAVDITKRVKQGTADAGNCTGDTDNDNFNGLGVFAGSPNPNLRILWYFDDFVFQWAAARDAHITDITQLEGKKYNPGGAGGSIVTTTKNVLDLLGVHPQYFDASQQAAADAFQNRQIMGTAKGGPVPDSFIQQLQASVPLDIIGLTDDQLKKVIDKYPYYLPYTIPAGAYKDNKAVKTLSVLVGAQASNRMSQDVGYHLVKAMMEGGQAEWKAAYPGAAKNDILKMTLNSPYPLQAGMVQYLVEKGIQVPAKLIPPEYKPVK